MKVDIEKELNELIFRFKRLRKAIEEEDSLSPVQRAAAMVAQKFVNSAKKPQDEESTQAQNLANLLKARGILGTRPSPRQPTDEELFGHLVTPEEDQEKLEKSWGNILNDWMIAAQQPLNARFKSEEEERAYWDSIKVNEGDPGGSGY